MQRFALAVAATLALAAPAFAAPDGPTATASRAVSSSDLDLNRSVDASVMLSRLDRAAANVCGASKFSTRDVRDAVRASSCYRDALAQAVASLNAPTVNALYRERGAQVALR